MKKWMGLTVGLLAILAVGMFLVNCSSGGDDPGCKKTADCAALGANFFCNLQSGECECAPQCTGKCCGDNGCGGTCANSCSAGTDCNQGTCACDPIGGCTSGETRCTGNVAESCVNEAWTSVDCSLTQATCVNGACEGGGGCTAGETRCNANVVENCVAGSWQTGTDCGALSQTCFNGVCEASGCTAGEVRCNGTVIQNCSAGAWVNGQDCAPDTCLNGVCQVVAPTEECAAGLACTDISDGAGFLACTEGGQIPANAQTGCGENTPCNGVNTSCLCTDEQCTTTVCTTNCGTCPTAQTCDDLSGDGQRGCTEDGYIPANAPTGCDATPCPGNMACWTAGDPVVYYCIENCSVDGPCSAGAVRCNGDVIENCSAGSWVAGENCANSGQTCFSGACASADMCPAGQDCTVLAGESTGCIMPDGNIPAGNQTGCGNGVACNGNFSCWSLQDGSTVCIENCGTCPANEFCTDVTAGDGTGAHACMDAQGEVPAGAQTGCQGGDCNGNAGCWCNDAECSTTVCLFNCSVPH